MSDTTTDDSPRCPHCGSDKGTWFSRTEPMGDICEECGENVDEPPKISATKRWLTEDEQYVYEAMLTIARQHADAVLVRDAIKMIDRLCSELDKQQEVIGKLPKFADGTPFALADDLRAWAVWMKHQDDELDDDAPVYVGEVRLPEDPDEWMFAKAEWDHSFSHPAWIFIGDCDGEESVNVLAVYPTREQAEAASARTEAKP